MLDELIEHLTIIPEERRFLEVESNAHWSVVMGSKLAELPGLDSPLSVQRSLMQQRAMMDIALPELDHTGLYDRLRDENLFERSTAFVENLRTVLQSYGVSLDQLSAAKRAELTRALGQMARDASGKPVTDPTATNGSDSAKGNSSAKSSTSASQGKGAKGREELKAKNLASARVTRTIKGGKTVVVEIPTLLGKGYPAPADLDTGVASRKAAAPRSRRRR